jgi:hypothetical protein
MWMQKELVIYRHLDKETLGNDGAEIYTQRYVEAEGVGDI